MNQHQKQQLGFTLLELLLVLLIIIGILLASYSRYRRYAQEKDLAVVKQNIAMLQQAEDVCYAKMMAEPNPKNTPACMAQIELNNAACKIDTSKLLSSSLVKNKNSDYQIGAINPAIKIEPPAADPCGSKIYYTHQLTVSVTLDPTQVKSTVYDWYKNILGASSNNGNVMTWMKMPSYTVAGIGNNLWIMDSGLRVFKKTETAVPAGS